MVIADSIEIVAKKNGNGKLHREPTDSTLMRVEVVAEGITPLLQNRLSEETLEGIRSKVKKPKTASRPTPREECEPKVHQRGDRPVLPTENLLSCLIAAGAYVRLDGKRQLSTSKSTMLPAFLSIEEPYLWLLDPKTGKPAAWEVDLRAGRNPNGGEAVAICRPRFDAWSFKTTVQLDLAQIGEPTIRELFAIAGRRIGLCDFRPQRKGLYGQFSLTSWKQVR